MRTVVLNDAPREIETKEVGVDMNRELGTVDVDLDLRCLEEESSAH